MGLNNTHIKAALDLGKHRISVAVALTGFLGYYLINPVLGVDALLAVAGIFFLSMGSSALNQVQERRIDARMKRTLSRPIPAGIFSLQTAVILVVVFALLGTLLLALTGSWMAVVLGLFTLAWYNLVYTPLKQVTAFAVFPGALIGALPPMIGWAAAGGSPFDMEILSVAFLLFVGQMPHYWLLMIKIGKEFSEAGLPAISSIFSPRQIRNLSFIWIAATAVIVLMLPATPIIGSRIISIILIASSILFLLRMFRLSYRGNIMEHWRKAFMTVNLFYLLIIFALIADRVPWH